MPMVILLCNAQFAGNLTWPPSSYLQICIAQVMSRSNVKRLSYLDSTVLLLPPFLKPGLYFCGLGIMLLLLVYLSELAICKQPLRTMYTDDVTEVLLRMQVGGFC